VIYEYAVEPALVARWAKDGVVGLAAQFGLDQRRVVSDFPREWEGEVTAALLEKFAYDYGDPDFLAANSFLSALLAFMTAQMVSRSWLAQKGRTWIEQAQDAHAEEPFHAILAASPMVGHAQLITETVVNQLHDTRWYLPTVKPVAKTAEDLATILETLLRGATRIVVVDPYFNPRDEAYRTVLTVLLTRAAQLRDTGRALPSIDLITGVAEGRPDGGAVAVEVQAINEAHNRCEWASQYLGSCIPKGMQLTFKCVANLPDGDRLHNRFVLTDFAGASLPYGTQALGANVFDDISPLFKGQYEQRWRQFTRLDQLRVIGEPRIVESTRR
jgi:hypothetical protein